VAHEEWAEQKKLSSEGLDEIIVKPRVLVEAVEVEAVEVEAVEVEAVEVEAVEVEAVEVEAVEVEAVEVEEVVAKVQNRKRRRREEDILLEGAKEVDGPRPKKRPHRYLYN
jgi:hypothetical protein